MRKGSWEEEKGEEKMGGGGKEGEGDISSELHIFLS